MTVSRAKHNLRLYASRDFKRLVDQIQKSKSKENPWESVQVGINLEKSSFGQPEEKPGRSHLIGQEVELI